MNLNKRDQNILALLFVALSIVFFFFYVLPKNDAKIKEMEAEIQTAKAKTATLQSNLSKKPQLEEEIIEINNKTYSYKKQYHTDLEQYDLLALLESYNGSELFEITDISVYIDFIDLTTEDQQISTIEIESGKEENKNEIPNEMETDEALMKIKNVARANNEGFAVHDEHKLKQNYDEILKWTDKVASGEEVAVVYNVFLKVKTDYWSLIQYVKNINEDGRAYISGIDFSEIGNGLILDGTLLIKFVNVPYYKDENSKDIDIIIAEIEKNTSVNPFEKTEEYKNSLKISNDNSKNNVFDAPDVSVVLENFESGKYFFVGSPDDVRGGVVTYTGTKGKGAKLDYEFIEGKEENEASIVFDEPIILKEQVENLYLSIYSEGYSNNRISAEVVDAVGEVYDVDFAAIVNWVDWEEATATISNKVNYPAKIRRIFVTDDGEKSKVKGSYIFDELKVEYSLDVNYVNKLEQKWEEQKAKNTENNEK